MVSYTPTSNAGQPLRLAICGGGASAILLLAALKERVSRPIAVTIIEPREQLGAGVAYSTACPAHLLNTRACNMSVNADPEDFLEWLRSERRRRGFNWGAEDFAARQDFGAYLRARLAQIRGPNIHQRWLRSVAVRVVARGHGWEVVPAQGEPVFADIVVLATGNEAPRTIGADLAPQVQARILNNPWQEDRKNEIASAASVLIAGTGLTAVDVVVELLERRHVGPIFAFSRHGLLPRAHGAVAAVAEDFRSAFPASLRAIVKRMRELSVDDPRGERWRGVMTELRSMAPALWTAWDLPERRRFVRHVRPFWDVHRHRLAPSVHADLSRAILCGQLQIVRGRLAALEHEVVRDCLRATVRCAHGQRLLEGAVLINCTGPETHPLKVANRLLRSLIADGVARPDALQLGLATDQHSRVIAREGTVQRTLYALGTLARGSQWELTAVPEIRAQAQQVARAIELASAARSLEKTRARMLSQAGASLTL
jgi:uncharacterized NAD(P)/FAD-binding protein YdhS